MAYEQKPNSGTLWHQTEKTKESQPDFTGSIFFDRDYLVEFLQDEGQLLEMKFAGWRNKVATKNGDRHVLKMQVDGKKAAPVVQSDSKDPWDD
jgi:hypothetical protein